MFTGLVEEKGSVISLNNGDKSIKLKIKANKVLENVKLGDSIATNGVCLTVTEFSKDYFVADCMFETISRSNLKRLKTGDEVNLEKCELGPSSLISSPNFLTFKYFINGFPTNKTIKKDITKPKKALK